MPLSSPDKYFASRNVGKVGIRKGDELIFLGTYPYAASNGDTYYKVSVYRDGMRLDFDHCVVTHEQLTGSKDQLSSSE